MFVNSPERNFHLPPTEPDPDGRRPASERLPELRPLPNRRHLPGRASRGAARHRTDRRQGRSKPLDAATGDEPAQANEPGQHRDGSGGSSWLGTQKASSKAPASGAGRPLSAILQMQAEEIKINFRSVSARAQVSTAWLYGNQPLRDRIHKLRQRPQKNSGEAAPGRRQLSNERIVAALRLRVRSLEELNRELHAKLESSTAGLLARVRKHVVYMTTTCRTAQTKKKSLTTIDNSTNCHSNA